MALIEATRDVKGNTLTFIETSTGEGILKAGLAPVDIAVLETVDANGTGATLAAKMDGFALSNGRDALSVYGQNIYNMDAYAENALKKYLSGARTATTLADHEARIVAEETAV